MYAAVSSGDTELYDQLIVSRDIESLYIGKNGVSKDKTNVIVIDWRAPVSTLYYENELGAGSYEVPDIGTIPVDLQLRGRRISEGRYGAFDSAYQRIGV